MSVDEKPTNRVRGCIGKRRGVSERKMFGCIGFFLNGNLACGVHENELIVRVGDASEQAALQEPHTRRFDVSGRPMKGWLLVAVEDDDEVSRWVSRGMTYAATLPKK